MAQAITDPITDLAYYAPIMSSVLQARTSYLAWVGSLAPEVGRVIQEMSTGSMGVNLHGECVAFQFGELFGASEELQQKIAIATMAAHAFFLNQDYVIDESIQTYRHQSPEEVLLQSQLHMSFGEVVGDNERYWHYWNRYMQQYTEGCLWEGRRLNSSWEYSEEDLLKVAWRSAPVKMVATSLALATGQEDKIPQYELALDTLISGLQIKDDITDLIEDLERRAYSYAISKLCGGNRPTMPALARGVLYGGTLEALLDESTAFFHEGCRILEMTEEAALHLYIAHLIGESETLKSQVGKMRAEACLLSASPYGSEEALAAFEVLAWEGIQEELLRFRLEY